MSRERTLLGVSLAKTGRRCWGAWSRGQRVRLGKPLSRWPTPKPLREGQLVGAPEWDVCTLRPICVDVLRKIVRRPDVFLRPTRAAPK
jgi:hypothetical protein